MQSKMTHQISKAMVSKGGHTIRYEHQQFHVWDQGDFGQFKHHELIEKAKGINHCKICNKPIKWKTTSFSNLTCSLPCRRIYKQRQAVSLVL